MKKSIFKRICACFVMLVLMASSLTLLTGCGDDEDPEKKVMNVDVNPSIEFVLDEKDKVISVNASNDEGNYILTEVNFTGMTAKEAVNKFLEVAEAQGFIIPGEVEVGENTLKISISGDEAEALYNEVKSSAQSYLNGLNVNVTIQFAELTEEYLEAQVKECMKELTDEEIDDLDEEELVELIKASREETKNLFSEELKNLYYETRAEEIVKSKFEAVQTLLTNNPLISSINSHFTTLSTNLSTLETQITSFKDTFKANYLSGTYQQELQDVINAKKALLEERLKETVDATAIANLETALAQAEADLAAAKLEAEGYVSAISGQIDVVVSQLNTALDSILNILTTFMKDSEQTINNAINTTKTNFKSAFETEFATELASAKATWESLKPTTPSAAA